MWRSVSVCLFWVFVNYFFIISCNKSLCHIEDQLLHPILVETMLWSVSPPSLSTRCGVWLWSAPSKFQVSLWIFKYSCWVLGVSVGIPSPAVQIVSNKADYNTPCPWWFWMLRSPTQRSGLCWGVDFQMKKHSHELERQSWNQSLVAKWAAGCQLDRRSMARYTTMVL